MVDSWAFGLEKWEKSEDSLAFALESWSGSAMRLGTLHEQETCQCAIGCLQISVLRAVVAFFTDVNNVVATGGVPQCDANHLSTGGLVLALLPRKNFDGVGGSRYQVANIVRFGLQKFLRNFEVLVTISSWLDQNVRRACIRRRIPSDSKRVLVHVGHTQIIHRQLKCILQHVSHCHAKVEQVNVIKLLNGTPLQIVCPGGLPRVCLFYQRIPNIRSCCVLQQVVSIRHGIVKLNVNPVMKTAPFFKCQIVRYFHKDSVEIVLRLTNLGSANDRADASLTFRDRVSEVKTVSGT